MRVKYKREFISSKKKNKRRKFIIIADEIGLEN